MGEAIARFNAEVAPGINAAAITRERSLYEKLAGKVLLVAAIAGMVLTGIGLLSIVSNNLRHGKSVLSSLLLGAIVVLSFAWLWYAVRQNQRK
ncbi:MAG: hypothetical protein ACRYFX_22790 [Janthinobacterium lividum]